LHYPRGPKGPLFCVFAQLRIALRDRSDWYLHLGFFTCGVHIALPVTHLRGEIAPR